MNDDRMALRPDDIRIQTENGEYLSRSEAIKYLQEQKSHILIKEKANIGDSVKLNDFDDVLIVKINDGKPFQYGAYAEGNEELLVLFEQEDIKEIVSKKR